MAFLSTTVIKVGGAVLNKLDSFWEQTTELLAQGPVLLVHGGGNEATRLARQLGHEPRMVKGRRVTSSLDMRILEWTLRGQVNLDLVAQSLLHGLKGVGVSGADAGMITVTKRPPWNINGEEVDFGRVGDITKLDPGLLFHLMETGYLPVVAPMGLDSTGQRFNVNGDTVASSIAVAIKAKTLLLVTVTGGIRHDPSDPTSVIPTLTRAQLRKGQEDGWISGGMHVKATLALEALEQGVRSVFITGPDDLINRSHATQIQLG